MNFVDKKWTRFENIVVRYYLENICLGNIRMLVLLSK